MLDGTLHYLEGAIELSSLRFAVGVSEDDKDFMAFVVVDSETDHLPVGACRDNWSSAALARLEPEIQQAVEWAKGVSWAACQSIVARFGTTR